MSMTVVPLTDLERNVLADFAAGDVPAVIAKTHGLPLDAATAILVKRTTMDRKRAAGLIAEPNPAESPLTAAISRPNGKAATKPTKSQPPAMPMDLRTAVVVRELATSEDPEQRAAAAEILAAVTTEPVPQPEPPPTTSDPAEQLTAAEQLLDDGVREIAERLRTLVASLAVAHARTQLAAAYRKRVGDLEAQLAEARAELAAAEVG